MTSVVLLGTLDTRNEEYEFLRDGIARLGCDDTQCILDHITSVAGFFGVSSMARLPTEVAITENMRRFERIARTAIATG